MDRPNGLTPEAQRIIAEAIRRGCYYTTAYRLAGVGYQTFRRWRVRCEAGDEVAAGGRADERRGIGAYRPWTRGERRRRIVLETSSELQA